MDARQLRQRLAEREANSGVDIVMLESMYDVHKIQRYKLLQNIDFSDEVTVEVQKYSSWKYDYVGFGVDPYIIAHSTQQPNSIKTYNDLTRFDYVNKLAYEDEVAMLAPSLHKMKKVKANNWIKKYVKHRLSSKNLPDSLHAMLPTLLTFSSYKELKTSSDAFRKKEYLMPNRNSTGTFYNTRTFCIVNQAENYVTAKTFVSFFLEKKHNSKINERLNTLSIYNPGNGFRRYSTHTENLLSYFIMVERVLQKLDID